MIIFSIIVVLLYVTSSFFCVTSITKTAGVDFISHANVSLIRDVIAVIPPKSYTPKKIKAKSSTKPKEKPDIEEVKQPPETPEVHEQPKPSNISLIYPYKDIYGDKLPTFEDHFDASCTNCLAHFGEGEVNSFDYNDIQYPIPFSILYNDYKSHYVNYDEPVSLLPSFVWFGDIKKSSFSKSPYIVVTGSTNHQFFPSINLLYSIVHADIDVSIVFVDCGLTEKKLQQLALELDAIHRIHRAMNSTAVIYYRKFNFANFPEWWSLDNKVKSFSWKVVSYFDVLRQTNEITVWSGYHTFWKLPITDDINRTKAEGMYIPMLAKWVKSRIHPMSQLFLSAHGMILKEGKYTVMCDGDYVLLDPRNREVMNKVVYPLVQCAFTQKCISPKESDNKNHNQDRGILTMLSASLLTSSCKPNVKPDVTFNNFCKKKCAEKKDAIVELIESDFNIKVNWNVC